MQKILSGLVLVFLLGQVGLLTSCIETEHSEADLESETEDGNEQARKLGEALYTENCASCHQPLDRSDKLNASLIRLQNAFVDAPAMWSLQNRFSDEELKAIVIALSPKKPDETDDREPPQAPGGGGPSFDRSKYDFGVRLYSEKRCAQCHGAEISQSAKRNISMGRLSAAIGPASPFAPMRSIDMTSGEQEALVYALNNMPPTDGQNSGVEIRSLFTLPVGNRHFIASKLKMNFLVAGLASSTADDSIADVIQENVKENYDAFRGGCSGFDHEDLCRGIDRTLDSQSPKSSSVRSGYLNHVCEKILSIDQAPLNLLTNASLNSNSRVTSQNLQKLWSTMILSLPLPQEMEQAYIRFSEDADQRGLDRADIWKFIMLNLCKSPFYEVF